MFMREQAKDAQNKKAVSTLDTEDKNKKAVSTVDTDDKNKYVDTTAEAYIFQGMWPAPPTLKFNKVRNGGALAEVMQYHNDSLKKKSVFTLQLFAQERRSTTC